MTDRRPRQNISQREYDAQERWVEREGVAAKKFHQEHKRDLESTKRLTARGYTVRRTCANRLKVTKRGRKG